MRNSISDIELLGVHFSFMGVSQSVSVRKFDVQASWDGLEQIRQPVAQRMYFHFQDERYGRFSDCDIFNCFKTFYLELI